MKHKIPVRKRVLITVMALCLLLSSVLGIVIPANAASFASKWAWRDESGNIYIRVEDKKKTSDIYYQTLGFTITRCVLESKVPVEEQYITVRFNEFQEVELGNGQIGTAFVISEAELMQKIAAASGDWLADIQSGKTCYLRFDSIMMTVNGYYDEPICFSGWMLSDKNQDYLYNDYNPHPGVYDKFCKEDLKTVYGWASPKSIDTHFDIWLLYNGGKEEATFVSSDHVATIGKGISPTAVNSSCHDMGAHTKIPEYFTWNHSDEFDLSQGIPSGENITNGYGADTWYGNADIHKYEEEKVYTISYDLIYHTYDPIYMTQAGNYVLDANGDKIQIGLEDNVHHVPFTAQTKRKVMYLFAANVNLYELTEVDVYNSVYPGDANIWTFPGNTVQMEVELDGEINPSQAPDWNTDPEMHIIWPEWYSDSIVIDVGEGAAAAALKEKEIKDSLASAWENNSRSEYDPIEEVESWNDLIEVNYIKYLDNEPVKALDTSRIYINYKDMPAGKDDTTYLFKEGQVTVTIPKDVANGAYSTSMDVLYTRRILNDNMVKAFSTEDNEDSIYNHLKSGYEQNEPVYVHTPVISPVSITNGETGTQLITENLTSHTGLVDKDGRVPDGKAIYELILDNEIKANIETNTL